MAQITSHPRTFRTLALCAALMIRLEALARERDDDG